MQATGLWKAIKERSGGPHYRAIGEHVWPLLSVFFLFEEGEGGEGGVLGSSIIQTHAIKNVVTFLFLLKESEIGSIF